MHRITWQAVPSQGYGKELLGAGDELKKMGVNIEDIVVKKVHSGDNTLFWLDNWCGSGSLKIAFPGLYQLEKKKKCKVSEKNPN